MTKTTLTINDIATRLGVGTSTVRRMIASRELPGVLRLDRRVVRIDAATFEKWYASKLKGG